MRIGKIRSRLLKADVVILSLGKSGRTWLRVLLNKYLSLHYAVPFSIDDLHEHDARVPSITYQHHLWMSLHRAPLWVNRLLAMFPFVSEQVLHKKKVILLTRDPRDTMVSLYFQLTRRSTAGKRIKDVSIADFIRHPYWGVGERVRVMNQLFEKTEKHPHRLMLTYETMRADTANELRRILDYIGIEPNAEFVTAATAFADFENMRQMEQNREISGRKLRPGDPSDPESFKVRRGKVGGYLDYFDESDVVYLEQQITALHIGHGYSNPASQRASVS